MTQALDRPVLSIGQCWDTEKVVEPSGDEFDSDDLIGLLAVTYGVRAELSSVGRALSKRAFGRSGRRERIAAWYVIVNLVQNRATVASLRQGHRPTKSQLERMATSVAICRLPVPADEAVDTMIADITSALRDLTADQIANSSRRKRRRSPRGRGRRRREQCEPLDKGGFEAVLRGILLDGAYYCLAGLALGLLARRVRRVAAVPLAVIGGLLFLAGTWNAVFGGGFLFLIRQGEKIMSRMTDDELVEATGLSTDEVVTYLRPGRQMIKPSEKPAMAAVRALPLRDVLRGSLAGALRAPRR